MNDIIWAINPRNDNWSHVIDRLQNYASRTTQSKNIALQFAADDEVRHIPVRMGDRKNLYLICKEAINNAIKYSECRNLLVTVKKETHHLRACIRDDGKGFNAGHSHDGNGLKNMRKRASDMQAKFDLVSHTGSGTEVTIQISLS